MLPRTGCCHHCGPISGARCLLRQPGRQRSPAADSSSLAPHQILHLSLLSGAQGLREHWGGEGAAGSSIMNDPRALKSWLRGEDGEAEGAKLTSQEQTQAFVCLQNSVYTNVGPKDKGKDGSANNYRLGQIDSPSTQKISPITKPFFELNVDNTKLASHRKDDTVAYDRGHSPPQAMTRDLRERSGAIITSGFSSTGLTV